MPGGRRGPRCPFAIPEAGRGRSRQGYDPHGKQDMTRNDSRGPLAPHDNANGGQDGPAEPIRDPLAAIAGSISDDPSVAELIAFRRSAPDLQAVAIDAKRCGDEAWRLLPGSNHPDPHNRAWVALAIAGLSCSAIVAIW